MAAVMSVCLLMTGCSDEQQDGEESYKIFSDGTYIEQEEQAEAEIESYDFADFYVPAGMINSYYSDGFSEEEKELYGEIPPMPDHVEYKEVSFKKDALDGKACRLEIDMIFTMNSGRTHTVPVLIYYPADTGGKVPVFINLNFKGNHTVTNDKDVRMSGLLNDDKSFLTEEQRSCHAFRNSIEMVIARGYGCCTASYNDFFPDHIDGWNDSIYSLFGDFKGYSRGHEKYSAIGCLSAGAINYKGSFHQGRRRELTIGDQPLENSYLDVYGNAEKIVNSGLPCPRVFHCCGDDDFLLPCALDTKEFFEKFPGNPFQYQFLPAPGAHTWQFWDEHIQDFIRYLNLPDVSSEYK